MILIAASFSYNFKKWYCCLYIDLLYFAFMLLVSFFLSFFFSLRVYILILLMHSILLIWGSIVSCMEKKLKIKIEIRQVDQVWLMFKLG